MKKIQLSLILLFFGIQLTFLSGQAMPLNDQEEKQLLYLLEEEKLARDVYLALNEKWNHQVFNHIVASEERHFNSVKSVAKSYNLKIQSALLLNEHGRFQSPDLQRLYDELVNTGNQSMTDALKIGAKIEELDIKDLDEALAGTENPDLTTLYTRLRRASENHLRAFTKNLNNQGVIYLPIILTKKQYDDIVNAVNGKGECCSDATGKASCAGENKGKGKACCNAN